MLHPLSFYLLNQLFLRIFSSSLSFARLPLCRATELLLVVMKSLLLLVAALVDARTMTPTHGPIKSKVGDFDFCRWLDPQTGESNEQFWGCHSANEKVTYKESWEGQLNIHGLWCQLYNGSYPTMCTNEKLNPALLAGLEVAMEQN
jgi:hypothetical protein